MQYRLPTDSGLNEAQCMEWKRYFIATSEPDLRDLDSKLIRFSTLSILLILFYEI